MNLDEIYPHKCKVCGRGITDYQYKYKDGTCFDCKDKQEALLRANRLQNDIEVETEYEKDVICPYCGYAIEDDDSYFVSEGEGEYECPECGKEFDFQACVEVTYSTQRKEVLSLFTEKNWSERKATIRSSAK